MLRWCLSTVRSQGGYGSVFYNIVRGSSSTAAQNAVHHARSVKLTSDANEGGAISESVSLTLATSVPGAALDPIWTTQQSLDNNTVVDNASPLLHRGPLSSVTYTSLVAQVTSSGQGTKESAPLTTCHDTSDDLTNPTTTTSTHIPTSSAIPHSSNFSALEKEPVSTYAMETLKLILSPTYLHSTSNSTPTPNTIRSWYKSMKARSQLDQLTPLEFSSLIAIFGGISTLMHPQPTSDPYGLGPMRDLVFRIVQEERKAKKEPRTYWAFVTSLANDKQRYTKSRLDANDGYWVMRAGLVSLEVANVKEDAERRFKVIQQARWYYRALARVSNHPDVHTDFLGVLLDSPNAYEREEGIGRLCKALLRSDQCHARLLDLLWKAILSSGGTTAENSMARIVDMVQQRVRETSDSPTIDDGETPSSLEAPSLTRPEQLVAIIRKHIFSPRQITVDPQVHSWITRTTQAAFPHQGGSEVHMGSAFDNVVLLAAATSSSGTVAPVASIPIATELSSPSQDFRVIHMLSILEKLVGDGYPRIFGELHEEDCDKINLILDSVWTAWLSASSERPRAVTLVVASSFLYLAGRAKNLLLIRRCWEHCCSREVVVNGGGQDQGTYPLLAEYGVALLGIGSAPRDVSSILVGLEETVEGRSWVASEVLRRVAQHDPIFAHGFLLQMRHAGTKVKDGAILGLATSLIHHGHLEPAVSFLEETIYKSYKAKIVSLLLLRNLDAAEGLSVEVVTKVVGAMVKLHPRMLREHCSRRATEAAILSLAHGAQVPLAIMATCHTTRGSPFWLQPSIYTSLLEYAVDHRQFRAACRLFEYARRTYPRNSNTWCCYLIKRLSHVGASNLAKKLTKFLDSGHRRRREDFSVTLARRIAFRGDRPQRARTLSLPRFLLLSSHTPQTPSRVNPVHVIQLLTRAGRRQAAMRLFSRVRRNYNEEIQTAMGNVILDASLMDDPHYNHGRMRKALGTLKHLVSEEQFVPDRVTVNILIKALLLWRSEVDRYAVRALFDRMVRGGYPTGGVVPSGEVPFGSEDGPGVGGLVLPKLDSRIDFVRHVKPLYKMFAKALFLRGDYAGARKVVGILKWVKAEHDAEVRGMLGRGAVVERSSSEES